MGAERVCFLHVAGLGHTENANQKVASVSKSAQIQKLVHILFDALCTGEYLKISGDDRQREKLLEDSTVCEQATSVYRDCFARIKHWENLDIRYSDLREKLASLALSTPHAVFDITSVSKEVLGDLVTICLVEGIHNLHTFAVRGELRFNNPKEMLFHALSASSDHRYDYINILGTEVFARCARSILVRRTPLLLAVGLVAVLSMALFAAPFVEGNNAIVSRFISGLSTVAGIVSLVLIFVPLRH
jgi:hypothetical protein